MSELKISKSSKKEFFEHISIMVYKQFPSEQLIVKNYRNNKKIIFGQIK